MTVNTWNADWSQAVLDEVSIAEKWLKNIAV